MFLLPFSYIVAFIEPLFGLIDCELWNINSKYTEKDLEIGASNL